MNSNIPNKESLTVEFKSDLKGLSDRELIEAVVAMSNTEGGELYLGVEDDGSVTGISNKHNDQIGLRALIMNKTFPSIGVTTELIKVKDQDVIKIIIPKSNAISTTSDGKLLNRRLKADGSPENIPLYPYDLISRLSNLRYYDYSLQTLPELTLDDLDPNERKRLRTLIKQNNGEQLLLELDDLALDQALGLVKNENGEIKPTITGLLLIGKENRLKEILPTAKNTIQILTNNKVRINEEYSKPLLETFEILLNYFKTQNFEDELDFKLSRISIPTYSEQAFREGLINAFSHRDYTILKPNRIELNEQGLTISSPGSFIDGINIKNLVTTEPQSRNPNLADALKRIGLAEKTGRGIDRIFEGSLRFGKALPDYSETTNNFVRLFIPKSKPDYSFTEFISKNSHLNFSIVELFVLYYLNKHSYGTVKQLNEEFGFSKTRIEVALESLLSSRLIRKIGKNNEARYELKGKNSKQNSSNRSKISEQEILDFIKSNGGITTRKELISNFKISKDKAYRILKNMVSKNQLILHNQGRSSYYQLPTT